MWWTNSWLLELIIKKKIISITVQKTFFVSQIVLIFFPQPKQFFCQESCFNFQSDQDSLFVKHIKFQKRKALKKN